MLMQFCSNLATYETERPWQLQWTTWQAGVEQPECSSCSLFLQARTAVPVREFSFQPRLLQRSFPAEKGSHTDPDCVKRNHA